MTNRFFDLTFTPAVKAVQEQMGSRTAYARLAASNSLQNDSLGDEEQAFIPARDSAYIATVSQTGWPYVQHRGGPPGFLKVLDDRTIGFADFRGNRQYVTGGNLAANDRASLFLMDYPNRRRLKLLGHARAIDGASEPRLLEPLQAGYKAHVEQGIIFAIEAFDWNCPQHITPRFSLVEVEEGLALIREKLVALEAENVGLRAELAALRP